MPVFADVAALMEDTSPDVVSICTPNASHRVTLDAVLSAGRPRAIWCEKPLAGLARRRPGDGQCLRRREASVGRVPCAALVAAWRRLKARLDAGEIGALRSLRVAMPNRLWSIGSHAVDLLSWLGGPVGAVSHAGYPSA